MITIESYTFWEKWMLIVCKYHLTMQYNHVLCWKLLSNICRFQDKPAKNIIFYHSIDYIGCSSWDNGKENHPNMSHGLLCGRNDKYQRKNVFILSKFVYNHYQTENCWWTLRIGGCWEWSCALRCFVLVNLEHCLHFVESVSS